MKKIPLALTIAALSASLFSPLSLADRDAIGDDGREIRLLDNGSWEYTSTDRFATSEDGTRVRLKDSGNWEFIGNAPMQTKEQVRTENLDITLNKVVTEFTKEKAGQKSERYSSQTIFFLDLDVSSYGEDVVSKLNDFGLLIAQDNKNTIYPVIDITPKQPTFTSGKKYQIQVRVDGSPSGSIVWGSRTINLTIDKSVFSSNNDLMFTLRSDEIKKQQVERLFEQK